MIRPKMPRVSTDIGIIGPPGSGCSTIFDSLTQGKAAGGPQQEMRIGVAKVPDKRITSLADMFHPQKTTPAEVKYFDIALASKEGSTGLRLSGPVLSQLGRLDALIGVVPAFLLSGSSEEITAHLANSVSTLNQDLALADLATIERRLDRLNASLKSARLEERQLAQREYPLLNRVHSALEEGALLRDIDLSPDEMRQLSGYGLLSIKPLVAIANLSEAQLPDLKVIEARLQEIFNHTRSRIIALCAQLEKEFAALDNDSSQALREEFGLVESGIDRVISTSYEIMDLVTFFTVGADEVKAWPVPRHTTALKAAGKIHSDIEKGFIRAEVISFEDLISCGSLNEARRRGQLRLEGKDYIIQDGDIAHFLFNI